MTGLIIIISLSFIAHIVIAVIQSSITYRMNRLSELRYQWLETPYLTEEQRARLIQYLKINTLKVMFNNYKVSVDQWDKDITNYVYHYDK